MYMFGFDLSTMSEYYEANIKESTKYVELLDELDVLIEIGKQEPLSVKQLETLSKTCVYYIQSLKRVIATKHYDCEGLFNYINLSEKQMMNEICKVELFQTYLDQIITQMSMMCSVAKIQSNMKTILQE